MRFLICLYHTDQGNECLSVSGIFGSVDGFSKSVKGNPHLFPIVTLLGTIELLHKLPSIVRYFFFCHAPIISGLTITQ